MIHYQTTHRVTQSHPVSKHLVTLLAVIICLGAVAQDPRERNYFYPVLKPSNEPKPKVEGWAKTKVPEKFNRGLTAMQTAPDKVYLSWRLLAEDAPQVSFNLYREVTPGKKAVRINKKPVSITSDYIDRLPEKPSGVTYFVRPLTDGKEGEASERVHVALSSEIKNYRSIRLQGDYRPQRMALADLNGDGALDFIIKQPNQGIDPGGQPNIDGLTYKIEAYLNDGTFLWRKDLGPGIEPGIWYSPMVAFDFDGDGKAEIAVKTGPADVREADGRVRKGPEWCSLLNGMTGEEICKMDWPARSWRFGDYNRNNRNQLGMAYLDGKTPFLLVARGTYRLMVVDAYQLMNNKLERVWHWDGDEENPVIRHQGAHNMHTADVDGDGRDEIVLGSVVLDDNGTALWSTGLGHPDKCFVTDIDPDRPGLEIFYVMEEWYDNGNGICLVDAKTGEMIWNVGVKTFHVGDGMVADILPEVPGLECFASEDPKGGSRSKYLLSAKGKILARDNEVPGCRNWIWWDADKVRENIVSPGFEFFGRPSANRRDTLGPPPPYDPGRSVRQGRRDSTEESEFNPGMMNRFFNSSLSILKYKGDTLATGIRGSVLLMADIQGDWREELITVLPGEMRIYSTAIPAVDRRVCLMQDPFYRNQVVHRAMGYEQSPVTSYNLGEK